MSFVKVDSFVYKIHLFAGAGSLLCTSFVLLIYYYSKRYRMHPNGILIHFMTALWISSLCNLFNGLLCLLGYSSFEFGGEVVSRILGFSIRDLEVIVRIFFNLSFLCWNVVWLYDLIKAFKQPMHTTEKLLPYYRIVVYFTSFCIFPVFYTFREELFSVGYKNTICKLEFIYLLLGGYTIYRYGRDSVVKRFKKTESKLQSFFRIQKCYIFLIAFCWILKTVSLLRGSTSTMLVYDAIYSVQPIILSLPWILSIVNTVYSYESAPDNNSRKAKKKNSLFMDILNKADNLQAQDLEDPGLNKKVMDDSLRNEIVEYFFKGIRRSLVSYSNYRQSVGDTDDSDLSTFKELLTNLNSKEKNVSDSNFIKDTSVLRRVRLIDKKEITKEAKREQVFKIPLDNYRINNDDSTNEFQSRTIKFISLGHKVFQNLRSLHNVNDNDIMSLFSIKNLNEKKLEVVLQSGKGGSFFIIPKNGHFLVKSINRSEYNVMKTILAHLYIHYLTYPNSYINPVYGCYELHLSENDEIEPQYFILMKNVLGLNKELLPDNTNLFYFDLKGSSAGRGSLTNPSILLDANVDCEILKKTYMDKDFTHSFQNLKRSTSSNTEVMTQLEKDASFFAKFQIIDYSLLLIIIKIPCPPIEIPKLSKSLKSVVKEKPKMTFIERAIGAGKSEIILEEYESVDTITVYRISNQSDVKTFKDIINHIIELKLMNSEKGEGIKTINFSLSKVGKDTSFLGGVKDESMKSVRREENQVTRKKIELISKPKELKLNESMEQLSFESNASTYIDEVISANKNRMKWKCRNQLNNWYLIWQQANSISVTSCLAL